jgi:protein-tyrosine phosphatase
MSTADAHPLRVLCVCTHNRTRSVIMAGLLRRHLARARVESVVETAGTMARDLPAMDSAVRLLAKHGIDAAAHRSRLLDEELGARADLILTAERDHVVWIAGRWPRLFESTFTLPELVALAERCAPRSGRSVLEWLAVVAAGRPRAFDYLELPDVGEIGDPTGEAPSVWEKSFAQIDDLTGRLADALA